VLDFVGPGYCLHAGTVCRAWRESYNQIAAVTLAAVSWDGRSISFTCGPSHTLRSAAFSSQATLRWAHSWGLNLGLQEYIAAKSADIATLELAHELGMPLTAEMLHSAAASLKLAVLQWFHIDAGCPLPQDITHSAARGGSIVLLQWLAAAGCVFDAGTSYHAALAGHMHVLQFLREKGCRFDKDCVDAAAERGDLAMVQWLLQQGCRWRLSNVAHLAMQTGAVALADWLLDENYIQLHPSLMCTAAEHGQPAMCQYLRGRGCEWDVTMCSRSCFYADHSAVLRWLHESGCPWDAEEVALNAAICGSVGILDYLLQQGVLPEGDLLTEMLAAAGAHNRLEAAVWLREHGADWPPALMCNVPAMYWSRELVAWARGEGCTAFLSEDYTDPYSEAADDHSSSDGWSSGSETDDSADGVWGSLYTVGSGDESGDSSAAEQEGEEDEVIDLI
jgi:hypothetical protein